jgi:hypothetical protein
LYFPERAPLQVAGRTFLDNSRHTHILGRHDENTGLGSIPVPDTSSPWAARTVGIGGGTWFEKSSPSQLAADEKEEGGERVGGGALYT